MIEDVETKKDICLRGIPTDVYGYFEGRAARNYRSVTGEVLAVLTAVSRQDATLPGLGIGEMVPAVKVEGA